MKKTIITCIVFLACICASGQNYTKNGTTFEQTSSARTVTTKDTPTGYTWKDNKGNSYPIFLHQYTKGEKAGRWTAYVVKTSAKTGKEYKYFLPEGEKIAEDIRKENK